jgi:hypothetical protein
MTEATIKIGAWVWSVWPTMPMPTDDWLRTQANARGLSWVHEYHAKREAFIRQEQHDPLQFGWEQPPMKILRALLAGTYQPGQFGVSVAPANWRQEKTANDIVLLGGNGSGKTEVQAKIAMEVLAGRASMEARCFSQNEQTSIRYIQRALYRYLPPELRKLKSQGTTTKISYKEATGFSENCFILPNHSACLLPTYKAYQQDPMSVEGGEADIVTWDEEAPGQLLETLRFRVHKKGGIVLGGFTPVGGYTETVGQYIEGAVILEVIPARKVVWDWWNRTWQWGDWLVPKERELVKGCPPGHVPLVVQAGVGGGRRFAVGFPTVFNPYTNVEAIAESVQGKPLDFALERLWGWPTKIARKAFPNFGDVHIVPPEKLPKPEDLTIYQWMDPHGDRNWFMLWVGVDRDGTKWVLREWPDAQSMGEWALPGSKPDGKVGPAQTMGSGKAFNDYKRIVLEIEGWQCSPEGQWQAGAAGWEVRDRRLDPRPAGTSVPSDEEARTYLDYLQEPIRNGAGEIICPGLDVLAGPDCSIEEGKQWVNNWLTAGWNPSAPVTPLNCPKFYVSSACENLIWSLRTWTGLDGLKGASKDPIDCLKGLAKMDIRHLPPGALGSYGGGAAY